MHPSPLIAGQLAAFLQRLEGVQDPRVSAWARNTSDGDPRMAVLVGCIAQDLSLPAVARLVHDLDARLGPALLEPWTLRHEGIEAACRMPWLSEWPHRDSLAGWIVAVGDLLREHPDPALWCAIWPDPRDLVRLLAARIPWMGRKSAERVKAWRVARWLVRGEGLPRPLWPEAAKASLVLPHPVAATPLGWFRLLPPAWEGWSARNRQEWTDSVITPLRPLDPTSAWVALETILRRGKRDHRCAELVGGCDTCPLRPVCKRNGG